MTDLKLIAAMLHKCAIDLSFDSSYFEVDGKRYGSAEIEAQAAALDGMVLVPREPTKEMLAAGEAQHPPAGKAGALQLALLTYRAMIAAQEESK